jgi:hypothetical protein
MNQLTLHSSSPGKASSLIGTGTKQILGQTAEDLSG